MDVDIIKAVLATLDTIPVKGKENLDAMLGCMNALTSIVKNSEKEVKADGR